MSKNNLVNAVQVRVVLVDNADIEVIPLSTVYDILPRFCRVPCQGLKLQLFGLSNLKNSDAAIAYEVQ